MSKRNRAKACKGPEGTAEDEAVCFSKGNEEPSQAIVDALTMLGESLSGPSRGLARPHIASDS